MGSALNEVVLRMTDATSGFLQPSYLKEGFEAVPDDVLAALLEERRAAAIARLIHVQGWETFGAVHLTRTDLGPPTSRRITEGVEWPNAELHRSIFSVTVQVHGDDPSGAFVKVAGIDTLAVEACFDRTCTAVLSLLREVWP